MICPNCRSELGKISSAGEPMIRGRGLLLKAESVSVICPKCKHDVPLSNEMAKALQERITIFFKKR